MTWAAATILGAASGVLAVALAAAVLVASGARSNRWLAALLVSEGVLQSMAVLNEQLPHLWMDVSFIVAASLVPPLSLAVLAPLETPLVRWVRKPRALGAVFALGAGSAALGIAVVGIQHFVDPAFGESSPLAVVSFLLLLTLLVGAYVFSLVASISAYRRAKPGTLSRTRAKAFAIAFGTRDAAIGAFLAALILVVFLDASFGVSLVVENGPAQYVPPVATIVYVLLLAYGILRTQLFDIDLKIKVGISRSTVATLGLVGVLAAAKVAEFYLSKTYGLVAGGVAAGVLLVLAPRLNRLGDKVASAALPRVSASAEYVSSRKVEVYQAAVEVAWEDGNISVQDRAILERLREKLEISIAESHAVETAVVALLRKAPPPAAPA